MRVSQQPGYLPQSPNRALSPWTAGQNRLLGSWTEVGGGARDAISRQQVNGDLLDDYFM